MLINRPEHSLLVCLWSKRMFGLIVDINNISGSRSFLEEYKLRLIKTHPHFKIMVLSVFYTLMKLNTVVC